LRTYCFKHVKRTVAPDFKIIVLAWLDRPASMVCKMCQARPNVL
jgi:hypothetical protein